MKARNSHLYILIRAILGAFIMLLLTYFLMDAWVLWKALIIFFGAFILFWSIQFSIQKSFLYRFKQLVGSYVNEDELAEEADYAKLVDKFQAYQEGQSTEIDLLKEREVYRREYLGNVSHELKTPLFSIQGYLLTLIEGGINDYNIRDKYMNRINKLVERLGYIVRDLDLISELETGELSLDVVPFDIVSLTQEIFDLLEVKAENMNINISFATNTPENIIVLGDLERIEQVMTNLIANAINYSHKKGEVWVEIEESPEKVKISVKDNGIGIATEHQDRIFERFYRTEASRSRNSGGSGLGLSIVKHILEAHGQKISVESKLNEGSNFYFYLPKP